MSRQDRPFAKNWEKKYEIPIIFSGAKRQARRVPILMKSKCTCKRVIDDLEEFNKHWLLFHSQIPKAWKERMKFK